MSFREPKLQTSRLAPLHQPKVAIDTETASAINCTTDEPDRLSIAVRALISHALSANSVKAYQSDLRELQRWGGELPWSSALLAEYLAWHADKLSVATLLRRLASLAKAHRSLGCPDPTKAEAVRATVSGIRRRFGKPQRQAQPILKEDLVAVCRAMGNRPRDVRDRALLLLGFAGAFRRSELVGIEVDDIEEVRQGIVVTLRSSKTDQFGRGRRVAIPLGRTELCPVSAMLAWRARGGILHGPLFRPIDRYGNVAPDRLSAEAVCSVVRERCTAVGYDASRFSGHSLRAGLATSAAMAGASNFKIRQQTGHASDAMLARYVRDSELWVGNAAGAVL